MAQAIVSANYLTSLRTAAATAVSVKTLSRTDSSVLGVIGAGGRVPYQIRAIARVRPISQILMWNRTTSKIEQLSEELQMIAPISICSREDVAREADILLSITSASEVLVQKENVRPGTHIAAMGVDTTGKQELDPKLVASAKVFSDSREQSCKIGECQHAVEQGILDVESLCEIGAVLNGNAPGRTSQQDVTLFDGTGVALQDLAVAARVVNCLQDNLA